MKTGCRARKPSYPIRVENGRNLQVTRQILIIFSWIRTLESLIRTFTWFLIWIQGGSTVFPDGFFHFPAESDQFLHISSVIWSNCIRIFFQMKIWLDMMNFPNVSDRFLPFPRESSGFMNWFYFPENVEIVLFPVQWCPTDITSKRYMVWYKAWNHWHGIIMWINPHRKLPTWNYLGKK